MSIRLFLPADLAEGLRRAGSIQERITVAVREYLQERPGELAFANHEGYLDGSDAMTSITWEAPFDIAGRIPRLEEREAQTHVRAALKAYFRRYKLPTGPAPVNIKPAPDSTREVQFGMLGRELDDMQRALGRRLTDADIARALHHHFVCWPSSQQGGVNTIKYLNDSGVQTVRVQVPRGLAARLSSSGRDQAEQCRASLRSWFEREMRYIDEKKA